MSKARQSREFCRVQPTRMDDKVVMRQKDRGGGIAVIYAFKNFLGYILILKKMRLPWNSPIRVVLKVNHDKIKIIFIR